MTQRAVSLGRTVAAKVMQRYSEYVGVSRSTESFVVSSPCRIMSLCQSKWFAPTEVPSHSPNLRETWVFQVDGLSVFKVFPFEAEKALQNDLSLPNQNGTESKTAFFEAMTFTILIICNSPTSSCLTMTMPALSMPSYCARSEPRRIGRLFTWCRRRRWTANTCEHKSRHHMICLQICNTGALIVLIWQ